MLKLLKYEIKESSRYFFYTILGNVIASVILALVIGSFQNVDTFSNTSMGFSTLLFLAAFALFVAAYVGFIFMMITSYRKDLYSDSAYLKFSLPLSGTSFLNAKILLLMFWGFIMAVVTVLTNIIVYAMVFNRYLSDIFNAINSFDISVSSVIFYILILAISFIEGIILLFGCITFVKSYFKNSQKGYIWFLFYILSGIVWYAVEIFIHKLIPYYIVIANKVSIVKSSATNLFDTYATTTNLLQYNIGSLLIYFALMIGLYIFTAYMLDKKVDI